MPRLSKHFALLLTSSVLELRSRRNLSGCIGLPTHELDVMCFSAASLGKQPSFSPQPDPLGLHPSPHAPTPSTSLPDGRRVRALTPHRADLVALTGLLQKIWPHQTATLSRIAHGRYACASSSIFTMSTRIGSELSSSCSCSADSLERDTSPSIRRSRSENGR